MILVKKCRIAMSILIMLFISGCVFLLKSQAVPSDNPKEIFLTSPSFKGGEMIPDKHDFRYGNLSPELIWSGLPTDAKSLAIICEDIDAPSGDWVHWVIYNIPANDGKISEGIPHTKNLDNGMLQGMNDFKDIGYDGPCPPSGVHRYFFRIYALKEELKLPSGATKHDLLDAMRALVVGKGELMGRSKR